MAQLVSFLASDRAGFITGVVCPIDGGMTAGLGAGGGTGDLDESARQEFFENMSKG